MASPPARPVTMAPLPAPLPTKAQSFLTTHTEILPRQDLSVEGCCAICLDAYVDEPAVRITRISGCNHIIGRDCLISMINNATASVVKCPLCRAVWIEADQQMMIIETRINGLEAARRLVESEDLRQALIFQGQVAQEFSRLWARARAAETGPFVFPLRFSSLSAPRRNEFLRRLGLFGSHPERSVTRPAMRLGSRMEDHDGGDSNEAYRGHENMRIRAANTGPRTQQRNTPLRSSSSEANQTSAIASNSNGDLAEPVTGENEYEELAHAIDDIRARAANTRHS